MENMDKIGLSVTMLESQIEEMCKADNTTNLECAHQWAIKWLDILNNAKVSELTEITKV